MTWERTGVAAIDAAVDAVLAADHIRYGWAGHHYAEDAPPLSSYREPAQAEGACQIVSEPLSYAFTAHGLYSATLVVVAAELGYDGRHPLHQLNLVGPLDGDERFLLDFTAAQYGERAFPFVFAADGDGWARRRQKALQVRA